MHRSELLQLRGEWTEALEEAEAQWACAHVSGPANDPVMGMARYQQGELLGPPIERNCPNYHSQGQPRAQRGDDSRRSG